MFQPKEHLVSKYYMFCCEQGAKTAKLTRDPLQLLCSYEHNTIMWTSSMVQRPASQHDTAFINAQNPIQTTQLIA